MFDDGARAVLIDWFDRCSIGYSLVTVKAAASDLI